MMKGEPSCCGNCLLVVGMAGIVVVFDFDKMIIEYDSDDFVVQELGATQLLNRLLPTMPWNTLMVLDSLAHDRLPTPDALS
ncbi:hypothetical protein HHK36_015302 [Tetracentron sinense]|uniref:Uncharacterized protein n=1 Tax=Tetracentron sinense TaxID=13715 RepID=A0A835DG15_TETSI|nr:hypothetical protein HHK36_015302 [Tetracentron sinense]